MLLQKRQTLSMELEKPKKGQQILHTSLICPEKLYRQVNKIYSYYFFPLEATSLFIFTDTYMIVDFIFEKLNSKHKLISPKKTNRWCQYNQIQRTKELHILIQIAWGIWIRSLLLPLPPPFFFVCTERFLHLKTVHF